MDKYINDKSEFPQSVSELAGHLAIFEGHDRPRYIHPENAEAGYLGIQPWYDYAHKPTYASEGIGTLSATKYYSIRVVPIRRDIAVGGLPVYGDATMASMPQKPSAASKSLIFNIPVHDQTSIKECGFSTKTDEDILVDLSADWVDDEFIGYTLKNVETGLYSTIYRNSGRNLFAYGVDFTLGDRYQILQKAVTSRLIYVAELPDLTASPETFDYYLIGSIDDNTTPTYELTLFAESSDIHTPSMLGSYLPPPNANCCDEVSNILFCGGGIKDETGKASYQGTAEPRQATATATEQLAVSVIDDLYSGADSAKIVRMTLGAGLTGFEKAVVGSYVDVSGSEDTGNDIEDARVLRVNDYDLDATAVIYGEEIYSIGNFNGTDTVVTIPPFVTLTNSRDWSLKIKANFQKLGSAQFVWINDYNYIQITNTNDILIRFGYAASLISAGLENYTTITIPAANWSAGFFELSVGWNSTAYFVKIDGVDVAHTGTLLFSKWLKIRIDVTIRLGALYTGGMVSYELLLGEHPTKSHRLIFNEITGTTVYDSINNWDGVVTGTNAGDAFWVEVLVGENTGNGTATAPVLTDSAAEDLWTLTCTKKGGDVRTAVGIADEIRTCTGAGADSIAVTNPTGTTARYTLGANLANFVSAVVGSLFTSTGFTNAGNDVADAVITVVDASLRYVEITNAAVVAETDDVNAVITIRSASRTADSIAVTNPAGTTARYALGANLANFASVEVGSRFTSVGFTNAGNDVTNAVITAVDASLRYVEITNASVVAETDDIDAVITISAVFSVEGNIGGTDDDLIVGTAYSNDYFSLTVSAGAIAWVVGDFLVFNIIKTVVTNIRWIEILNNDGIANADDETMLITLTPNYIQGNASGADETKFSEGMGITGAQGTAQFSFDADRVAPFAISWADSINQRLGLASKYNGTNAAVATFKVLSDHSLYFSDTMNPHRFRAINITEIGDSITGISSVADTVIIFCSNSIWRLPVDSLGNAATLISDNVRCPSQFSITKGEKFIMFYDGTGISVTDGVGVTSISAYKAKDYLANINKAYEGNIRGVYDRASKRFEYVFPMGTDTKNNYGMYITEGSWNIYPFSRPDCNALWTNYDAGRLAVYHGTSGGHVTTGIGTIWKHDGDTDGTSDTNEYLFEVTGISGQVISVSADGNTDMVAGDVMTIYPVASGVGYRQLIVSSISKTSTDPAPVTYNITVSALYDISTFASGDVVAFGLIPFDYGIKWTDFSSPQYKHQVRALHIDLEDAYGVVYVDHYLDMGEYPVATNGYSVYPNNTKLVIPFRMGKGYKYGFRLRGMSIKQVKISAFEIMFDTVV